MSRLASPRPSTQVPPIRFIAAAGREDVAGDRSGGATVLMKSSGKLGIGPASERRPSRSEVHPGHVPVTLPAGGAFRRGLVDPLQVFARQGDPERGHVLFQVLAAL